MNAHLLLSEHFKDFSMQKKRTKRSPRPIRESSLRFFTVCFDLKMQYSLLQKPLLKTGGSDQAFSRKTISSLFMANVRFIAQVLLIMLLYLGSTVNF